MYSKACHVVIIIFIFIKKRMGDIGGNLQARADPLVTGYNCLLFALFVLMGCLWGLHLDRVGRYGRRSVDRVRRLALFFRAVVMEEQVEQVGVAMFPGLGRVALDQPIHVACRCEIIISMQGS